MFLLVDREMVLAGPVDWRPTFFRRIIQQDYGTDLEIPVSNPSGGLVTLDGDLRIMPVTSLDTPSFDEARQKLAGPFWNFFDDHVEGYYQVIDKTVDEVRNKIKDQIPSLRYQREVGGFKHNLYGVEVWISTDRDQRNLYSNGVAGSWKFRTVVTVPELEIVNGAPAMVDKELVLGETWITVTNEDLQAIASAIQQHVQDAFNWEQAITAEVASKTSVEELLSLGL